MSTDFRIKKSEAGYRVDLYREGRPYVTFIDGLSQEGAQRQAQHLRLLSRKIKPQSAKTTTQPRAAAS